VLLIKHPIYVQKIYIFSNILGEKTKNEYWSVILGTLSISFLKGSFTFAIFTLSGKTPVLKET